MLSKKFKCSNRALIGPFSPFNREMSEKEDEGCPFYSFDVLNESLNRGM